LQRQAETVTQVLEEASEAVRSLATAATLQEGAEKQMKMFEDSVSKALTNFFEVSETVRRSQDETIKLVTDRFSENLAELRAGIAKLKPEGE
jgi:phasin family protein